jgi:effector-binding domain-containing protein
MQSETVQTKSQPMIYVSYRATMDSGEIGQKMGEAFQTLGTFIGINNIEVAGPALAVYSDYTETGMKMGIGFPVAAAALGKATGEIKAGTTPAGKAMKFVHRGPYDKLRETHGEIEAHFETEGLPMAPVAWEVYVTDPNTTPDADLVTEIFCRFRSSRKPGTAVVVVVLHSRAKAIVDLFTPPALSQVQLLATTLG